MGLFDFLKKKELAEIESLKSELKLRISDYDFISNKYASIIEVETEVDQKKKELELIIKEKQKEISELTEKLNNLNIDYKESLEIFTKLKMEISLYESKLNVIEFGIYEPVFDFERSDDFRKKQTLIIDKQKAMIQADSAVVCLTNWTVEGSEAKGRAIVNRYKKLMLRAFNGECDALISKVKWNNVNQMKERMHKLFEAINKLGEGFSVFIDSNYLELRQTELLLEYEFLLKRQEEKEELRRRQEELREEEKAIREYEKAQRDAEKEESNYQIAIEKAKREVEQTSGPNHEILLAKIAKLEQELKEARERKERALSMAQQTKRGYIYIISNIGSFGENIFKIGMTRRLEPIERIRELGDSSVPFQFDVHAMIYSDDAPSLELALHKAFDKNKVNMVNYRKEFFNTTIDDIESCILESGIKVEFIKLPEAMEYRETLSLLEKMNNPDISKSYKAEIKNEFPDTLI